MWIMKNIITKRSKNSMKSFEEQFDQLKNALLQEDEDMLRLMFNESSKRREKLEK